MSRGRAWAFALLLAVAVTVADQLSKAAIEDRLVIGERVDVLGPLQLTNVGNTGIAFGLAGGGGKAIIFLTVVALILIVVLFARDPLRRGAWPAMGLLVGGAVGNLIDRIAHEAVTDFIKLPMWPSFNLADIAITCGVVLLAWSFLRDPKGSDGSDASSGTKTEGSALPSASDRG